MKRESDNLDPAATLFDEVANLNVDVPLTVADTRETAGLLAEMVTPVETTAACDRVRSRLFAASGGAVAARVNRVHAAVPRWLAVAAAIALLVTGLAVFRILPIGTQTALQTTPQAVPLVATADSHTTTLIFPDEAVIDARLACLEVDLAAVAEESFWKADDTSFLRSEQ